LTGTRLCAQEPIEIFEEDVDGLEVDYPNLRKFVRMAHEFAVYITTNTGSLVLPHPWMLPKRRRLPHQDAPVAS
jgi:hypothetical protein